MQRAKNGTCFALEGVCGRIGDVILMDDEDLMMESASERERDKLLDLLVTNQVTWAQRWI